VKKRYYFLIFTLIGLSLTNCEQPKSFQEIERTFKNSKAIEERSLNQQTDAITLVITNNHVQESRNNGKSDRTTNSSEESAIVLGIFWFCLMCYLLVAKFRGWEEANQMLRRIRRRVK
jgi:cytochrome c biogenesis protein ResB